MKTPFSVKFKLGILILTLFAALIMGCSSDDDPPRASAAKPDSDADTPADITPAIEAKILAPSRGTNVLQEGQSIYFRGYAEGGIPPYTYSWDFDGAREAVAVVEPGHIFFENPGNYTVTFAVTDADGVEGGDSVKILVQSHDTNIVVPPLLADIVFPESGLTITAGQSVDLRGASAGGLPPYQYTWQIGTGGDLLSGLNVANVLFDTPGNYNIVFRAADAFGQSDDVSVLLIVKPVSPDDPGDGSGGSSDDPTDEPNPPVNTDFSYGPFACATAHTVARKVDGTLWGFGGNGVGQLAVPYFDKTISPKQIGTDSDWFNVTAGRYHTLAVKYDGTLWGWGGNNFSQLGLGDYQYRTSPVMITNEYDWYNVFAGRYFTIALKNDGTLWAWGENDFGQLGVGSFQDVMIPTQIGEDNDWLDIAAGYQHVIGIKTDGTLWAWGDNESDQLGLGPDTVRVNRPLQIGTAYNWKDVAAGTYHTLALKSDGTLWAWGYSNWGQLGAGTMVARSQFPMQIGSANDWEVIAAGHTHSLAIKNNGTLWAWGDNRTGQLGLDYARNTPAQVGNDQDWDYISGGDGFTVARKDDGVLWAWGANTEGQLGIGTEADTQTPTRVGKIMARIDSPADGAEVLLDKASSFSGTAIGVDPPFSFEWDFKNGGTSTSQNPNNIVFKAAGLYQVKLTTTDVNGIKDYDIMRVKVIAPDSDTPPKPLSAEITLPLSGTAIIEGEALTFRCNASGGSGTRSYDWNFDGGAPASTSYYPENVVFNTPGEYAVRVTVRDQNGNTVTSEPITIVVYRKWLNED